MTDQDAYHPKVAAVPFNGLPLVLNAREVAELIPKIDSMNAMRCAFRGLGDGTAVQPAQLHTLLPNGQGDFITYLGALGDRGVFGAKLSPYLPQREGAIVTAWTLLLSMETGEPLLLCDSKQLTAERTAATTALAVDLLALPSVTRLSVIGSGALAQAHIRHLRGVREWTEIRVYSPRLIAAVARQEALAALDPRVRVEPGLGCAVENAEVIVLCTSSGTPVLDPDILNSPALITSISGDVARAHEVPPGSLSDMDVYCDHRASAPLTAGEMTIAAADYGWSANSIRGDLPELLIGRAKRPSYTRNAFFRSIGLGIEDVAMASAMLRVVQASI